MGNKSTTRYRDAESGEYVKKEYAEKHPKTTVKETDKKKKWLQELATGGITSSRFFFKFFYLDYMDTEIPFSIIRRCIVDSEMSL